MYCGVLNVLFGELISNVGNDGGRKTKYCIYRALHMQLIKETMNTNILRMRMYASVEFYIHF